MNQKRRIHLMPSVRHSRESGNLGGTDRRTIRLLLGGDQDWIPACAGMTAWGG